MNTSKEILGRTGAPYSAGDHTHCLGPSFTLEVGGGRVVRGAWSTRWKFHQAPECSIEGKMQTDLGSHPRPDVRWGHLWSHVPTTEQSMAVAVGRGWREAGGSGVGTGWGTIQSSLQSPDCF